MDVGQARSVYITATGPGSGESVVALGLVELLSARVARVGFLEPRGGRLADLMRARYGLAAESPPPEKQDVVAAFRGLEADSDVVVCAGGDLERDAELANELGCPVLVVTTGDAPAAREALERKGCELFGVIVNRASGEAPNVDGEEPRIYVLPEHPELGYPTVADVAAVTGAQPLVEAAELRRASWAGASLTLPTTSEELLQRDVRAVRIAAMSVEHFIDDLEEGTLVIVPGDRPDVLIASVISTLSSRFPTVAGVLVTAGYELHPAIRRLLETAPFPVLEVPDRTFATATKVGSAQPRLTAENERKLAAAAGLFESAVDADELFERINLERTPRMTPTMFEHDLMERAGADPRHIVLPEGDDERVLRAAELLLRRGVVELTILGDVDDVSGRAAALGLDLEGARLVDPAQAPEREEYAAAYHELRGHKGVTEELAFDTVADVSYFGTLMVRAGHADGMVSGAAHTTGDTIRPAFEIIKSRPDVSVVSSVFLMCMPDRVLVYGDCAVNPNPDAEQLAGIAASSAETAATFGVDPLIAMLSYSTGESGKGADVDKVREATELVRERHPELKVEGPIQYDAAVDPGVAEKKLPGSEVAGRATVFVFPDLETGNIAYKAVQRSSGAIAIGPVLQGLNKPVNDLSRGCLVPDVVSTVVITAIQAQEVVGRSTSRLDIRVPTG
ncbi:MAG TPA: phosphate acetyltransferase [Thermoleophilaceae bacterium]